MARQRYLSRVRRNSRPEAVKLAETEKSAETDIAEPKIRLRQIRKAHGISQTQLGKLLNVTGAAVGAWESGKNEMNSSNLIAVSKIFKCSIDYLLCNTESEGKSDGI